MSNKPLIFLELNEISIDFVKKYISSGELPNFKKLLSKKKLFKTRSEEKYHLLEPWIQWVTVHTGLDFKDHKIFRLGDGINHEENIWNKLNKIGINSILISPMNSKNPKLDKSIYVPDPWNDSGFNGNFFLKLLHKSVSSIVNNNANNKFNYLVLGAFLISFFRFAKLRSYPLYFKLFLGFSRKKWNKAIFLDLLLFDVFSNVLDANKYKFSSIFLNGSAHIQHHYFHSSKVYDGKKTNPNWYCSFYEDPLLDVYKVYDKILENLFKRNKNFRILIASGLSQEPTENPTYYWRLKNHSEFLTKLKINFLKIEPRMSRDFVVFFKSFDDASLAEAELLKLNINNQQLFEIDNRGSTLFVTLKFPDLISSNTNLYYEQSILLENFFDLVSLVALKNGKHNEVGYFIDSDVKKDEEIDFIPLKSIYGIILQNFKI